MGREAERMAQNSLFRVQLNYKVRQSKTANWILKISTLSQIVMASHTGLSCIPKGDTLLCRIQRRMISHRAFPLLHHCVPLPHLEAFLTRDSLFPKLCLADGQT